MTANKFKILLPKDTDKEIVLPIEVTWDFADRSDSLVAFEKDALKRILNEDKDFEVARFSPAGVVDQQTNVLKTDVNYEFNFVPNGSNVNTSLWLPSYVVQGFTTSEVYFYAKSFENSFFKLDLYNTPDLKTQTNYVTLILPPQQGELTATTVGYETKNIKTPIMKLDYLGNKEGLFIYWLKNRDFLNIDTFYMTAKFFDAKNGYFVKMMNRPQSSLTGDKFNFPQEKYFYYKVVLDYNTYTYKIYDITGLTPVLVGGENNPIKWYEYINP
jgi:hypothetical protein